MKEEEWVEPSEDKKSFLAHLNTQLDKVIGKNSVIEEHQLKFVSSVCSAWSLTPFFESWGDPKEAVKVMKSLVERGSVTCFDGIGMPIFIPTLRVNLVEHSTRKLTESDFRL